MIFCCTRFLSIHLAVLLFYLLFGSNYIFAQGNDNDTVKEYLKQAKTFYFSEDYEKSIELYSKAGTIAEKLHDYKTMCIANTMIGHAHLMNGKNQEALDSYYFSLDIAKRNKDLGQELKANSGLIIVLKRMNQLDKALVIVRQMLRSIDKTPLKNSKNHVNILTTSSEIYLEKEQYDSVLYYADQGVTLSQALDYKVGLVDLYVKKGMTFYYKENYEQSFDYLFKAQEILQEHDINNEFYPTVNSNYFLARCYYKLKSYDKAINKLLNTVEFVKEADLSKPPVIQSYLLLASCYGEKKDFEKALYWHNEYQRLNKNYQKNKDKTVSTIYEKEAQKLEIEIATLRDAQVTSKRNKRYTYIGFVLLLMILLFFVFRHFRIQKANKVLFEGLMQQINQLETQEPKSPGRKETGKDIVIDGDKVEEILRSLNKLEAQEYFLKPDCNLTTMSKKVKTNVTYLSRVINIHKHKNFNDYLNDLRIEYVLKRLKDDKKFRLFSVKSIANEIGYKSDYSFAKHFKAKTGLNPSYYIKKIKQQELQ